MAEDFKSAMEVVEQTHYKKLFTKAETPEKTVSAAEKALKQEIFEHAQTTKIGDPFNVGSVMAFIMRKGD